MLYSKISKRRSTSSTPSRDNDSNSNSITTSSSSNNNNSNARSPSLSPSLSPSRNVLSPKEPLQSQSQSAFLLSAADEKDSLRTSTSAVSTNIASHKGIDMGTENNREIDGHESLSGSDSHSESDSDTSTSAASLAVVTSTLSSVTTGNNDDDDPNQKSRRKSKSRSIFTVVFVLLSTLVLLSSPFIYLIYTRFGIGHAFPDQPNLSRSVAILPESVLEIVAKLPLPPGNVAVSSRSRVFFTFHPEYNPVVNVAELADTSSFKPFPSMEFQKKIFSVLSLRIDTKDRLWLLDFAHHALSHSPQLIAFQLGKWKDEMVVNYTFPHKTAGFGSMLNDFQVDPSGEFIYIADTSIIAAKPGLIVYSVVSQRSWRILESHSSMFGSSIILNISGSKVGFGPLGMKVNVDSIVMDRTGNTLYYGAVTDDKLFSIATAPLLNYVRMAERENGTRSEDMIELANHVRLLTNEKPATDGLSCDGAGNLYLTAIEHSAIVVASPVAPKNAPAGVLSDIQTLDLIKVVESKSLLRWPDGLSFGPKGLYITNSALHLKYLKENITQHAPFHILMIPSKHLKNKNIGKRKGFSLPPPGQ